MRASPRLATTPPGPSEARQADYSPVRRKQKRIAVDEDSSDEEDTPPQKMPRPLDSSDEEEATQQMAL